ncbi:MAG TPA: hypothetical protein VN887_13810 [Candidatus Angelobacter sp.]|nr:hypothetical protein [Candidatus Angelobacter sp.]
MDYTPLLWIAAAPAAILGQIYLLGRKMSEPEKMLLPVAGGLTAQQREMISHHKDWLASVGLEFRTCFQFGNIQVAVFQQGNLPRFFSFMFHQRITFSVESYLEDLTVLDTSSSGSLGLFPRPGAYAQSFPNVSAEETWRRHLEGEAHLTRKFGFAWVPLKRSYEEIMLAAVRIRMKYNRSQFLWPARVLYRYAVTRHRIANRSIAQQFP